MSKNSEKKSSESHKGKRLAEIRAWFDAFQNEKGKSIAFKDNAAEKVNETYWYIVDKVVRPRMEDSHPEGSRAGKIDRHKVISCTEMAIMKELPIKDEGIVNPYGKQRENNARLAYFCGMNILLQWCCDSVEDLKNGNLIDEPFEREHLTWLIDVDLENYPIFANACAWYFFHKYIVACNLVPSS